MWPATDSACATCALRRLTGCTWTWVWPVHGRSTSWYIHLKSGGEVAWRGTGHHSLNTCMHTHIHTCRRSIHWHILLRSGDEVPGQAHGHGSLNTCVHVFMYSCAHTCTDLTGPAMASSPACPGNQVRGVGNICQGDFSGPGHPSSALEVFAGHTSPVREVPWRIHPRTLHHFSGGIFWGGDTRVSLRRLVFLCLGQMSPWSPWISI